MIGSNFAHSMLKRKQIRGFFLFVCIHTRKFVNAGVKVCDHAWTLGGGVKNGHKLSFELTYPLSRTTLENVF